MKKLRRPADELLLILSERLNPIIDNLTKPYQGGLRNSGIQYFADKSTGTWVDLLHAQNIIKDMDSFKNRGVQYNPALQRFQNYSPNDPHYLLKILQMYNIRGLEKGFFKSINPNISKHSSSLLTLRNHHCNFEPQAADEVLRGLNHAIELLEIFGDHEGVAMVRNVLDTYSSELGIESSVAYQKPQLSAEVQDALRQEAIKHHSGSGTVNTPDGAESKRIFSGSIKSLKDALHDNSPTPIEALQYEPWVVEVVGAPEHLERIRAAANSARVRGIIQEIVGFEGPISMDRLIRLTAYGFGIVRLTSRFTAKIKHQIYRTDEIYIDADKFVWGSLEEYENYNSFRQDLTDYMRAIIDISPKEIANAFLYAESLNTNEQELTRTVLTYFNRTRQTKAVTGQLNAAQLYLAGSEV